MPEITESTDLRYPIGKHRPSKTITAEDRRYAIQTIAEMPECLRESLRTLDQEQIDTPYREGGWTVRQVVHHIADSHMTAFHRVRMALSEEWPTVQGYPEAKFAMLPDSMAPVEWSLELIEAVHARWVMLMQALTEEQWKQGYMHAERGATTIEAAVMMYAWHSLHHVAHVAGLRKRLGW